MTATTAATSSGRRQGFTLVEVLVAMALIIFIMVILTEAFTAGTGVFRTLKAQGDMQEKLRSVTGLLRDDLRQIPGQKVHFGENDPPQLSALGINGNPNAPSKGYFYIQQPAQQFLPLAMQFGSMPEGVDGFSVPSVRMNSPVLTLNAANQLVSSGPSTPAFLPALCFTVNRRGTQPQDYFAARIPGQAQFAALPAFTNDEQKFFSVLKPGDYQQPVPLMGTTAAGLAQTTLPMRTSPTLQSGLLISPWAEIGYFLVPTGLTAGTTTPVPTYSLRRRLRVVLNDSNLAQGLNTGTDQTGAAVGRLPSGLWGPRYAEVRCLPDATANSALLFFNTPSDLINPPLPTAAPALPPCGLLGKGCQVLVPPLSPAAQAAQQTPVPQPQLLQQSLVPIGSQQQGQTDWAGDDIILTDVISFNVRVLAQDRTTGLYGLDFLDLTDSALALNPPGFYNTGSNPPPAFTITALEITIRVWDTKTSQTRQVTLVQDM